jgi:RND family efflux transporter MFP subunit
MTIDGFKEFVSTRPTWQKTTAIIAVLVIAVVALTVGRHSSARASKQTAAPAAMTVTTVPLQSQQLSRSVAATGAVYPWQEVVISSEVGGYRVAAIRVDVGDHVRKDQELVRLSDDLLSSDAASKRANVLQAQATLENAASALRRAQSLSGSGALSASDVDKLKSEEIGARAKVEVAKADLDTAELKLRYTRVLAPDDGVITVRTISVGQIAQAGNEMLRLLRQGRVEWRAEVPEARLREIARGQTVKLVTADGSEIEGTVRTVSPTIQSSNRTGLVYVDIKAGTSARPGMFARGQIVTGVGAANMAPLASIATQDGYSYVFTVNASNIVERRRVETGVVNGDSIEVVSGLGPGERVVDKGAGFLREGDRVSVVTQPVSLAKNP